LEILAEIIEDNKTGDLMEAIDTSIYSLINFPCSLLNSRRIQSPIEQYVALSMITKEGNFAGPGDLVVVDPGISPYSSCPLMPKA